MGTELIQCKFCGRSGDGVEIDRGRSSVTCRYCGTTSLLAGTDGSLGTQMRQWRDEEVNNCRILLIDTIREASLDTNEFIDLVQDRALAVSEKCKDDFLAKMCLRMIRTENGLRERRESGREAILKDIKKCQTSPQDILGLILFIRRMNKSWPCYERGLDDLYDAAVKFGIDVPPDGDHSGETELPPIEEERAVFSQDVPARHKMGDLTVESIVLENGVTKIGESAFDGCENISQAEFGKSVREIGGSAFCGCKRLQKITIPRSVQLIGACAFRGCGLMEVVFEDPNGWHAVSFGGKEEEIPAFDLMNGIRAAGMLSKKYAGVSFENCSWYKRS